jgi:hypothetical protein
MYFLRDIPTSISVFTFHIEEFLMRFRDETLFLPEIYETNFFPSRYSGGIFFLLLKFPVQKNSRYFPEDTFLCRFSPQQKFSLCGFPTKILPHKFQNDLFFWGFLRKETTERKERERMQWDDKAVRKKSRQTRIRSCVLATSSG